MKDKGGGAEVEEEIGASRASQVGWYRDYLDYCCNSFVNRVGKKRKRVKGPDAANKLPDVTPHTEYRLRLLK